MSQQFGGFVHTTCLSTSPPNHDPVQSLASNIIRDYFGPNIQLIVDALLLHGPTSTLTEITNSILKQTSGILGNTTFTVGANSGSKNKDGINKEMIANGLLVLYQHSFLTISEKKDHDASKETGDGDGNDNKNNNNSVKKRSKSDKYTYSINVHRIICMIRYARYLEYLPRFSKYANSATIEGNGVVFVAQCMLEELFIQGRMMTLELVETCHERLKKEQMVQKQQKKEEEEEGDVENEEEGLNEWTEEEEAELRERVTSGFVHLVEDGYICSAPFLIPLEQQQQQLRKQKKVENEEDEKELEFLQRIPIKHKQWIAPGSVWEVNIPLFHCLIRAHCLGQLIAERYGDTIAGAGAIITAALKYQAFAIHSPSRRFVLKQLTSLTDVDDLSFSPEHIIDYLPLSLLVQWKNNPATMNVRQHLSTLLQSLAACVFPQCILEVEEAIGHPKGGVFEVATRAIQHHLQARTMYAVVRDRYGQDSARICNILQTKGYLESEAIAQYAMVPAKEVRTLLHTLYKSQYIQLLNMQMTKAHNPNTAIYLWTVYMPQLKKIMFNDTCTALLLLRLRRQHETEVGKDWIERAKEAGALDENDHEVDKLNYAKFCQGLERLDSAVLDLDESLMVLRDF